MHEGLESPSWKRNIVQILTSGSACATGAVVRSTRAAAPGAAPRTARLAGSTCAVAYEAVVPPCTNAPDTAALTCVLSMLTSLLECHMHYKRHQQHPVMSPWDDAHVLQEASDKTLQVALDVEETKPNGTAFAPAHEGVHPRQPSLRTGWAPFVEDALPHSVSHLHSPIIQHLPGRPCSLHHSTAVDHYAKLLDFASFHWHTRGIKLLSVRLI